jgi:hypothetical protein
MWDGVKGRGLVMVMMVVVVVVLRVGGHVLVMSS